MKKRLFLLMLMPLLVGCAKSSPSDTPNPPSPPIPTETVYSVKIGTQSFNLTKNSDTEYSATLTNLVKNSVVTFLKDGVAITNNIASEIVYDADNLIQTNTHKNYFYVHNDAESSNLTFNISGNQYTFWATGYEELLPIYSVRISGVNHALEVDSTDHNKFSLHLTNLSKGSTVVFLKDGFSISNNISSETRIGATNLIQGNAGNFYIHNQALESDITFTINGENYTFWATGYEEEVEPTPGEYDISSYYDGYYSSIVSWENSEDLINQLHTLINKDFHGVTYSDPNWETNQYSEQSLTDFTKLDVVYSQTDFEKDFTYKTGNGGWQREHAYCATLMTGYGTSDATSIASSGTSRATDWHNLFASYGPGNGARGNKNFGISDKEHPSSGTGAPLADYTADVYNFEPNDCDKGQLARAIFYMGVMYNQEETSDITIGLNYEGSKTKTIHVPAKYKPLSIQEDYVYYSQVTFKNYCLGEDDEYATLRQKYMGSSDILDISKINDTEYTDTFASSYADYRYQECEFAIGNLSTLLEWNKLEVSRREMQHNESVYSHVYSKRNVAQNNRNPFVDFPELVDYVYGIKKDQPGLMKNMKPSELDLDTGSKELSNYAVTEYKKEYNVGDTFTKDDYSLIRVNKDFSTEPIDFTDTNPDYTFVSDDAGDKEIVIHTPKNDVKYIVKVIDNSSGILSCDFIHTLTGVNGDFANCNDGNNKKEGGYQYTDKENPLTFANDDGTKTPSTLDWYGYWKNGKVGGYSATNGVTFGAQSSGTTNDPCETLYFKSKDNLKVNAIYILGDTGANRSYTMKIYCDDTILLTTTISRNGEPSEYGIKLANPLNGKIKVEFTGVNGTVILKSIGVNIVE